ncbi:PDZ domain-containing protein [Porphyromonas pogonae]|uniref:PDZ domain-containing protein n=1 Tax=Porphyromonas pogonae TaxID=867595 RepID=UPI002E763235|nr:PDZ domain-containing protein [Porphyromonas pogonae]
MRKNIMFYIAALSAVLFAIATPLSSQQQEIKIPLIMDGSISLIRVKVNSQKDPVYFMFDTGSEVTTISKGYSQKAALIFDKKNTVIGVRGEQEFATSSSNTLSLLSQNTDEVVVLKDIALTQMDFQTYTVSPSGLPISGIIGAQIIKNYSTEVDYDQNIITLRRLGSKVPAKYNNSSLSIRHTGDYFPRIPIDITLRDGSKIAGEAYFDSGADFCFMVNALYAQRNDVLNKSGFYLQRTSYGVDDQGYNYVVRAQSAVINKVKMPSFTLDISSSSTGVGAEEGSLGLIGFGFIKRFNFIIDMSLEKLYLIPNKRMSEPMWFPVGGPVIAKKASANGVQVFYVQDISLPGDAVAKCALRKDDEVISFQGKPVTSEEDLMNVIFGAAPGDKFTFVIRRDGKEMPVEFVSEAIL